MRENVIALEVHAKEAERVAVFAAEELTAAIEGSAPHRTASCQRLIF